ncbi:MAG TPA: ABC transporter permease [Firmicutes bacterium]|jgi:putative ABC transport system permease protein|nr:ABC transporter permease [Bacillota bacterium]
MKALDKRLIRTVWGAKAQYGAVIIIICIGLMILTSLSNTAHNLKVSVDEYYRDYRFADLFADFAHVPVGTILDLGKLREVETVEARIVADIRADVGRDLNPTLRLVSIGSDQKINRLYVQTGRIPAVSGERGIALLAAFAEANDLTVGDKIDLIIRGESFPVTVTALVDSPEFIYAIKDLKSMLPDNLNFGIGFVNMPLLQELLALPGQANNAVFLLRPGVDAEAIRDKIQEDYKTRGIKSIVTRENQVSHALTEMEIEQLERMSRAVPTIFLGIAAVVTYMLISRLVQADRTSIGILKATGFSNWEVISHYLKLALMVGLPGAVCGMGVGYLLAASLTAYFLEFFQIPHLEMRLYYDFILFGILSTVFFCGGTGFLAARGVLSIAPADAMRPKAQPPGKKSLLELWAPDFWAQVTFSWKLVLRGIWRNRRRFALATVGVALAYALILFSFYMFDVWDVLFNKQFGELDRYDYAVSFLQPVSSRAITEMRSQARITAIEPFLELPFQVARGWREQTLLVRALPKTTELQRFEDEDGNFVPLPTHGVFLSRGLAESLGVSRGESVEMSSYATGGKTHLVPVKAVVTQYLGSGVYMSLEQMERLTGQKDTFSGAVLGSVDDIKRAFQGMGNVESVYSSADLIDIFSEYLGLMITYVTVLVFVAGLLGFAILYNTTSVSIAERSREFSSLRVLGFSQLEIFQLVSRENLLALLAGLVGGAPLGKGLVVLVIRAMLAESGEMFDFPTDISAGAYLLAAVLSVLIMVLTLAAVWQKVRKLNFLEALSSRLT